MIELDEISKRAIANARRDMAKDIRIDVEMFRRLENDRMITIHSDGTQTVIRKGNSVHNVLRDASKTVSEWPAYMRHPSVRSTESFPMGASHGPRIPAGADLIWTRQKPTAPGWYAWKCNDKVYPYLTRVYLDGDTLMADMKAGSWNENHDLSDVSDREWFGPLPD